MISLLYNKLKCYRCYPLIIMVIFMPYLSHADKIDIVAYKMPVLMENPNQGLLVNLIKYIGRRAKMPINLKFTENERIAQAFADNMAIITIPGRGSDFSGYYSKSIFTHKIFAFYKKGDQPINSIYNLKKHDVGMSFNYDDDLGFMDILNHNKIEIRRSITIATIMRNLYKGRIDAVIMEEYSGLNIMKNKNFTPIAYKKKSPIWQRNIKIIFPKSDIGKKQSIKFNGALQAIHEDGSYKSYFKNAYKLAIYHK